jgi:predicted ATP-grasp superfamily ATP-dependent carboligase
LDSLKNAKLKINQLDVYKLKYEVTTQMNDTHLQDIFDNPNASVDSKLRLFYDKLVSNFSRMKTLEKNNSLVLEKLDKAYKSKEKAQSRSLDVSKKVDKLELKIQSQNKQMETQLKKYKALKDKFDQ